MQPTDKAPAIDALITNVFGFNRKEYIAENKCVFCGTNVKESDFRDKLSLKEFSISGICQSCQDKIFGV